MVERQVQQKFQSPEQVAGDAGGVLFKKGVHISTRPGKRLKSDRKLSSQQAVLEDEIIYESRVHFNDLYGFITSDTPYEVYREPRNLRPLPLCELFTTDGTVIKTTRMEMVDRFMIWMRNGRYEKVDDFATAGVNESVGTEDLVHFINQTLSPAAAYAICTGKTVPGNFGEKLVQRMKPSENEKNYLFDEKEQGLLKYFKSKPEAYELAENGKDGKNRQLYCVKAVAIEISSDSDSD
jgi:hypothetical protein